MPHINLEHSANLDLRSFLDLNSLFKNIHELIAGSLGASIADCKSRLVTYENFYIGADNLATAFVHLNISVLAGRELALRESLAEKCFEFLKANITSNENLVIQYSVEIREMDKATYRK